MKNPLLTAVATLALGWCAISGSSAQTAFFTFADTNGAPNSGTYGQGQSFDILVSLTFAPGGSISNLEGLSWWLQQNTGGPFGIQLSNRDFGTSLFNVAQSPGISYPQTLAPSNASDLGATLVGSTGVGAGTYFIARLTITISATAANGTYTLGNTFAGPKTSVIADDQGRTFAIAASSYQLVVAPETGGTLLLLSLSALGLLVVVRRQQVHA